jgi:3-phenylpropionate/cinnamic acid dioxygenase small subunit
MISISQTLAQVRKVLLCCSIFFVSLSITHSGLVQADDLSLEQRIQRMEDEKEIRDLMSLYGQHLDAGNFAAYSQLFAKEGTWSGRTSNLEAIKGPAAIQATMEKAFSDRDYNPAKPGNLHLVTNIKIDVDGSDRATGYAKYTVMTRNENNESIVRHIGRYEDVYIREDGRWKFLSRVARREMP